MPLMLLAKAALWIAAVVVLVHAFAADQATGVMHATLWGLFGYTALAIFNVTWLWVLAVNVWRGLRALASSSETRSLVLKYVVCSAILGALVWGFQSFVYKIADTSFWGAIAICAAVLIASLIFASAVDRSRMDHQ
jgi:hypothetical protein